MSTIRRRTSHARIGLTDRSSPLLLGVVLMALGVVVAWWGLGTFGFGAGLNRLYGMEASTLTLDVARVEAVARIPLIGTDRIRLERTGSSADVIPTPGVKSSAGSARTVLYDPESPAFVRYADAPAGGSPGTIFLIAGAVAMLAGTGIVVVGFGPAGAAMAQQAPDTDRSSTRFAGNHRHGA